jgi:hypothetical protein
MDFHHNVELCAIGGSEGQLEEKGKEERRGAEEGEEGRRSGACL